MLGFSVDQVKAPSLIKGTIKTAIAIGLLSVAAANWLSGPAGLDQSGLNRLAAATARDEPVTTGSLGRSAAQTRLDPCVAPRR